MLINYIMCPMYPYCMKSCNWETFHPPLTKLPPLKEMTTLKRLAFHKLLSLALFIEDCDSSFELAFVKELMKLPTQLRMEFFNLYKFHYPTVYDLYLNYEF